MLLIAPTGGGKTLAGFLPTLVELSQAAPRARRGLHTLYISPLKALAVDIARNLETPIAEMGLPIRIETRTGDTPASKRQRQRRDPPDILLTTPEQLALLLASADAPYAVRRAPARRARRAACAGDVEARRSAVARPRAAVPPVAPASPASGCRRPWRSRRSCAAFWCRSRRSARRAPTSWSRTAAPRRIVTMLEPASDLPWAGHSARHALPEIYELIKRPQDDAGVRQHAQPGRDDLPGALAHQRRQPRHRAASRLARRGAAPQGRGRDGRAGGCARWCAPPRSISASTGATSIS